MSKQGLLSCERGPGAEVGSAVARSNKLHVQVELLHHARPQNRPASKHITGPRYILSISVVESGWSLLDDAHHHVYQTTNQLLFIDGTITSVPSISAVLSDSATSNHCLGFSEALSHS